MSERGARLHGAKDFRAEADEGFRIAARQFHFGVTKRGGTYPPEEMPTGLK